MEWLDIVALRSGTGLIDPPTSCDGPGCHEQFDIRHALTCKVGGLIHRRHNDVVECVQRQAEAAGLWASQAAVLRRIESNRAALGVNHQTDGVEREVTVVRVQDRRGGVPAVPPGKGAGQPGLEGDLTIHGLFNNQRDAVLDVRVFDADAASYERLAFATAVTPAPTMP